MAIATLTTMDNLLKDVYLPRLRGQFYKQTPVFNRVEKRSEKHDFVGRKCLIAAHYQRSEAVGSRAENATLPTAQYQRIENLEVTTKYIYGKIKLTGQTISASRRQEGAFAKALNTEMEGIKESLLFDLARQMVFGDGTGKLAMTNGSGAASTSLIVDTPGVDHIRAGMVIDVYDTVPNQEINSVEVSSVNRSTNTVTLASAATWDDNSFVYREDARNVECMGLGGILDDGTRVATFQGLARSSNTWLNANILSNSSVNRALTLPLLDDAYLEAEKNGGGGFPTAVYSKHVLAQIYADIVRADRRYSPKDLVLDGGFRGVEYTGNGGTCPWIMDRMCRANEIWFVNENDLMLFEQEALQWFGQAIGDPIMRRAIDGTDAYEATLLSYLELAASRCNGHTALKDVSETR